MLPFLKWAGGKRWLVQSGQLNVPSSYDRLVEPFLGGAAVFFSLEPARALLSDINPELIEAYHVVRDDPDRLKVVLEWHQEKHSREHYYEIRQKRYKDAVWRAARTLYLNRACWNGLYRVNQRGEFNVPIGTKTRIIEHDEGFSEFANVLAKADIFCQDFEVTINNSGQGDFLFVDPPYTVKHNMNGFLKYNEAIFTWEDQVRLRDSCVRAAERGAKVIVTNADHESVRQLYTDIADYSSICRTSVLAGNADYRTKTTEAVFRIIH
ncbi:MAG TPA: Dam family site-specific DNA-(adenine-N6)-methyltransferase [Allosphingosinicella sp.]|nr:Dam family site-specific DNA-(adenine-N6)-methyltransferase [Allosphingosinicella sp.]